MSFLNPNAFWFAAAIPVVIVFYLLKRKRVVQLVSSTVLWQKFLAETQASSPFQRLRHNWLLVLQLLMLALVIFSAARPYFSRNAKGGTLLVTVLDASASMQSKDEAPTRFEKARADALRLVDSMHDSDQMVVLQAAIQTEVKQSPTSDKRALRRALAGCAVTDTPTRLKEALKLAETLIQSRSSAEVHLFSDGAAAGLEDFETTPLPLVYHKMGSRGRNLAVTGLDVRPNPDNAQERAVFASVSNFSSNKVETEVQFRMGGELLEAKPVALGPGETVPQIFFLAQKAKSAVLTVRIAGEDDLALDNEASIVSVLPANEKVLLVTRGNSFLVKAIRAVPRVELTIAPDITNAKDAAADLAVLDGVSPAIWPAGNVLAFRVAPTNWFAARGVIAAPAIVDWKTGHPLLRFVGFDNVDIMEAMGVQTPTWAAPLVESPQTPLMLAGELGRQRIVWVGFDVVQSTWPLRISFPIFIANALEWLNPSGANAAQLTVRTGEPLRIGLKERAPSARVELPGGAVRQIDLGENQRELVFAETWKQGIYKVSVGTNAPVEFCVNLMDSNESNTNPRAELKFGRYARAQAAGVRRGNAELWRWIAAVGLMVLMWEWWYYHRRTA